MDGTDKCVRTNSLHHPQHRDGWWAEPRAALHPDRSRLGGAFVVVAPSLGGMRGVMVDPCTRAALERCAAAHDHRKIPGVGSTRLPRRP